MRRIAQALAIRNGRIVYIGDDAGARAQAGQQTRFIDLKGRMLMPGLIDGHHHSARLAVLTDAALGHQLTQPKF
jgi:predicted amidohydrolase YtcJ